VSHPSATQVAIGTAARRAGVSPRMVRHYESLGLLAPVARTEAGYRQYSEADIHALRFIRRARDLGFSMPEIATLLGLWQDKQRASASVKQIAQTHIDDLQQRIAAMQAMQRTLAQLVSCCAGDARPDCPILDDLAAEDESDAPAATARRKLSKK
jgi:Cu(I)-responsive transcriptional regulator